MKTWQDLTDLMESLRLSVQASYLHGSLVGYIAGGGKAQGARWLDVALQDESLSVALPDEIQDTLSDFRSATEHNLADEEYRFFLLLPDDESGIGERAQALSDWCGGFLGGLGLATHTSAAKTPIKGSSTHKGHITMGGGQLSADASEAIRDLERIARAEIELDDDDEANEAALIEIGEYIKVSAALIYQELVAFKVAPESTVRRAGDRTH
jgi:uncharacterized protein